MTTTILPPFADLHCPEVAANHECFDDLMVLLDEYYDALESSESFSDVFGDDDEELIARVDTLHTEICWLVRRINDDTVPF